MSVEIAFSSSTHSLDVLPFNICDIGTDATAAPNTPACIFMLRTVTFMTTQSGGIPLARALMCMNFSAPMSEPNPASVTTKSFVVSATRSAMMLEFP